jgi:predicted TIM-barrel fold metal-dependent hydrolase
MRLGAAARPPVAGRPSAGRGREGGATLHRASLSYALLIALAAPAAFAAPPAFEEIPKIDVHSHIFEDVPEVVEMMDRCRIRIVNVCVRGTDPERLRRMEAMAEQQQAKYGRSRFPFASTFDLTRRDDADYAEQVKRWLDASFEKGAVMVKIWKEVGMEIKDRQGRFVLPDDPLFDPIYAFLTERGKPLLAHLAEPREAWLPLDPQSVHYGYYSKNPEWHLYGRAGFPSHADILASRDRILERHPRLTVIGAHLGSLEHDVDDLARRLDRYPNFSVDSSARTVDLTRQPHDKVRAFLIRYQDRVLYGLDQTRAPDPQRESSAEERRRFARSLEESYRRDFRYYAGQGEVEYRGKTVQCLALPREILEKLYHRNAKRLVPGLD